MQTDLYHSRGDISLLCESANHPVNDLLCNPQRIFKFSLKAGRTISGDHYDISFLGSVMMLHVESSLSRSLYGVVDLNPQQLLLD